MHGTKNVKGARPRNQVFLRKQGTQNPVFRKDVGVFLVRANRRIAAKPRHLIDQCADLHTDIWGCSRPTLMALTPFGFDKFAMPLIADDAAHIGMKRRIVIDKHNALVGGVH